MNPYLERRLDRGALPPIDPARAAYLQATRQEREENRERDRQFDLERKLRPRCPRPAEDRMEAARAALYRIEEDLLRGAWAPVPRLIAALRARDLSLEESLWCL